MIEKEFLIKNSHKVIIHILGKKDLPEIDFKSKEELNSFYVKYVSAKYKKKSFILDQTHGDKFYKSNEIHSSNLIGDAIYSDQFNEILIIKTADCMPYFFWSNQTNLIGLIHSGWKGTNLGISEKLLLKLKENNPTDSFDSYLGPCIRQNQFEVRQELLEIFSEEKDFAFKKISEEKYLLDLKRVLEYRLKKFNLQISIQDDNVCTKLENDFFSHRRNETGRNLNLIYMEKI